MCDSCEKLNEHIASLVDSLRIGSDSEWESSEPMAAGGPAGLYQLRAPFTGDCQFKADIGSCGSSAAVILVSSTRHTSIPLLVPGDQGTSEYSPVDGLLLFLPTSNTIPIDSEWYNIRNSDNTLYIAIMSTAAAAYVNIIFRQKRGK